MEALRIATAQFENRGGDKAYNLGRIRALSRLAHEAGAHAVAFHECSITGYTFAQRLTREELFDLAEPIPDGESLQELQSISRDIGIAVLAGLFERGDDAEIYKAYVCVDANGLRAKYRKLHPFIHPAIKPGSEYVVFDLHGWKCGILICYDNNILENVRAPRLLGAQIIFMPHVTMGTPSPRPGAGFFDELLWTNREGDPAALRAEFDGPKGRAWLLKWLPARAYDNASYVVFSNPVGMDDNQLKNGCSMIIDPYGDIVAECRSFEDEIVSADFDPQALVRAGGARYLAARRPLLYGEIIGQPHVPIQKVSWRGESNP